MLKEKPDQSADEPKLTPNGLDSASLDRSYREINQTIAAPHQEPPSSCQASNADASPGSLPQLVRICEHQETSAGSQSPRTRVALEWMHSFLCAPHADLGRPGHVCPFVKPALDTHRSLYFCDIDENSGHPEHIQKTLLNLLESFRDLISGHEAASQFLAAVLVMPESYQGDWGFTQLKAIQERLKPTFATQGLMIGQLHPLNTESGLHNEAFRALESPVPLFVYRLMQINDLPFLTHDAVLVNAYKSAFHLRDRKDLEKALEAARVPKLPIHWESFVKKAFD